MKEEITTDARLINKVVNERLRSGRVSANSKHGRVYKARTKHGELQVKCWDGHWKVVESVKIFTF